jgi:hypothetical protein
MNIILKNIQNKFLDFDKSIFNNEIIKKDISPIFIIGLPRSGTTFLYQILLNKFKLVYISNLMYLIPNQMINILKFTKNQILSYKNVKDANYGFISGFNSPSEAGEILRFWFDNEYENKKDRVRKTIFMLSQITQTEIIIKNLYNIFRVDKILELFPNSKFIYIKREPLFVGQSIYLARKKRNDDFFGIKPEGYEKVLKEPAIYQIAWQIKELERLHEVAEEKYPDNFITVKYENLEDDFKILNDYFSKILYEKDDYISKVHIKKNLILLEDSEWNKFINEFEIYYENIV